MKKQNVRTISLIVCIFTFLLVGAAIFDALESDYEAEDLRRLMTIKTHFLQKYNITDDDFRNMTVLIKQLIPHNARQWKFAGAFYYSVTVMTTIGYGHSTPRTFGGKAFTMFYAFISIPLGLVMFQSIGERLNVFATFLLANIKKCFRFKNAEVSQTNLIVIDSTLALLVVFVSAAVFDTYEKWGYWNAVYYCIITLTTIGFGDLVPLQSGESEEKSDFERRPEYVVFTLMFILFGLTVLSANMNLLVLRFMTVNTEDERRDEMEAAVAALTAVDGDVIYNTGSANRNMLMEQTQMLLRNNLASSRRSLVPADDAKKASTANGHRNVVSDLHLVTKQANQEITDEASKQKTSKSIDNGNAIKPMLSADGSSKRPSHNEAAAGSSYVKRQGTHEVAKCSACGERRSLVPSKSGAHFVCLSCHGGASSITGHQSQSQAGAGGGGEANSSSKATTNRSKISADDDSSGRAVVGSKKKQQQSVAAATDTPDTASNNNNNNVNSNSNVSDQVAKRPHLTGDSPKKFVSLHFQPHHHHHQRQQQQQQQQQQPAIPKPLPP